MISLRSSLLLFSAFFLSVSSRTVKLTSQQDPEEVIAFVCANESDLFRNAEDFDASKVDYHQLPSSTIFNFRESSNEEKNEKLFNYAFNFCAPKSKEPIALATYHDTVNSKGWGELKVQTVKHGQSSQFPDLGDYISALYAGYVEGCLTSDRIKQQVINYYATLPVKDDHRLSAEVSQFLKDNIQYLKDKVALDKVDDYSLATAAVLGQFQGVVQGHAAKNKIPLALATEEIMAINSNDSIGDLQGMEKEAPKKDLEELTMSSCSAFIKVIGDNEDIVAGHTTWRPYCGMLRIFKTYTWDLSFGKTSTSFSSAPGTLSSHDDWYQTTNGLHVMETTNEMFDTDYLRKFARPQSFLVWQRVLIANALATTGPNWVEIFNRENSGLYNNQWMIIDHKLFEPKMKRLPDNLLTIAEQLPDQIVSGDGTERLRKESAWPSYNIPYFKKVFDLSGYPAKKKELGDDFSYETASRALIFARESKNVKSLDDLKRLMRYNKWQTDPLSKGLAHESISSRYDLSPEPKPFGGADSKVTSLKLMKNIQTLAISGPTSENQEVFVWSTSQFNDVSHLGMPDRYDFDFELF